MILGHIRLLQVVTPRDRRLGVVWLLHSLQQAQVVEKAHKEVGFVVAQAIAPAAMGRKGTGEKRTEG